MIKNIEFAMTVTGVLTLSGSLIGLPQPIADNTLHAQTTQASISGSATSFSSGNNLLTTVSGSVTLPAGLFYNGNVTITPTFDANNRITSLSFNTPVVEVVPSESTFSRSAANVLTQIINNNASVINNIEALSAIIRAGAGSDGLD